MVLYSLLCVCLPNRLLLCICYKLFLDIFKLTCIYLGMMQNSHPHIWNNLGVILWIRGGINDLNVVSLIRNFCVTESTTLYNPQLSDGLSYHCVDTWLKYPLTGLVKIPFNFIQSLKLWLHHLEYTMAWYWDDKLPIKDSSSQLVFIVLYLDWTLISFRVIFQLGVFMIWYCVPSLPNCMLTYGKSLFLSLSVL